MPEQQSKRDAPITAAEFTAPFETQLVPFGLGGLNLTDDLVKILPTQYSRLTNLQHQIDGAMTSRPGQQALATGGTEIHSLRLFKDPQAGVSTRIWGTDSVLRRGLTGALTQIDTGYSGDPLTLTPHRPPLSGDPWLFVADRSRMRKVRFDGLVLPQGLPAPAAAPTVALLAERRTTIANFEPTEAQHFTHWTSNPGFLYDANGKVTTTPTNVPFVTDVTDPNGATGLNFETIEPFRPNGYYCFWGCLDVQNLDLVGGVAASDDDYIHCWLNFSHTDLIEEFRIYLVCSALFDPTILPGIPNATGANTDAYVKAFSGNDFALFILAAQAQKLAAETARIRQLRDQSLTDHAIDDQRASWADRRAERDTSRTITHDLTAGNDQWGEFGVVGVPLRRGDWQRIGQTANRSWDTITGIVTFVKVKSNGASVAVRLSDLFMTGGSGPDTGEPGAQQYDYRTTDYDPRTGAESNPGPEMAATSFLDSLRRRINITPPAATDSALRQRIYRRGGSLIDDWYFEGVNTANGGAFLDELTDDAIVGAGTVAIDHFQPVPTINDAGATVLAQAVPAQWGPLEGMLFACGDPYRPGHLYYSNPDAPDHWSASGNVEVCPPSEELMHGGVWGHQGFVFSRERLHFIYPSLSAEGAVDTAPSLCNRGLKGRWAFATGPGGIYFVAEDGLYRTTGGPEEWLSQEIDPLFKGEPTYGYEPINLSAEKILRLTVWENKLYFLYQDTSGDRQVLVYDILLKFWRHYGFGRALSVVQGEQEDVLVMGSLNLGAAYTHEGLSDDGLPIACTARSGSFTGGRREEKLFGDQILDADRQGVELTLQNFLNEEAVSNNPQAIAEGTGRQRYVLDSFGTVPQRAHGISTELRWSSAVAAPVLYQLGYAVTLQPDITVNRVTNWDDLGHPDESWVTGITLDVDTFNVARTIVIERDFGGVISTIDTLTVQTDTRHKVKFSWPAVPANQVRIRPSDECKFWVLYRADWISLPEPPRISGWDIHFENAWDQYYTGLDLYCDTLGQEKRIEVYVDEVLLANPATGLFYFPVVANGRRVVHLTLPWGRGHVFRFKAIDLNPGLLYMHRWHLQEEPSEQANWNQNFSVYGTRSDKWLKAIIFECDTFGQNKSVQVEVDGTVVETLTVNANGRRVVQLALTAQQLGRVWRMFPVDSNPGRLYTAQPIFDEEPFQLDRWETQETNHGLPGWFYLTFAHITLKSTRPVTLRVEMQVNQRGKLDVREYTIPATEGEKQRRFVTFSAVKGVLVKYVLTSEVAFYVYREETVVHVQPWGGQGPQEIHIFGDDDLDPTRPMTNAALAAEASGGSLGR